jgi:4-alpha-glucanotransferase
VVTGQELERLARAHGVQPVYRDWHGRRVRVGRDTLQAILGELGALRGPGAPATPAPGATLPAATAPGAVTAARAAAGGTVVAPRPKGRSWGFAVQLYSVRSRDSWGHGDLRDLADLASWSARDLGAGFVVVNPLHAAEPAAPVSPSPYLPMTRRYVSPLYLRVEDVPEYGMLGARERARIGRLAAPLRERNTSSELIDRDAVWAAKSAALGMIYLVQRSPQRQADFECYRSREAAALEDWATWCALAEVHGPDFRTWPGNLAHPRSAGVARERDRLRPRVDFHAWLQWLLDGQLADAQHAALAAGMAIGVISDLAVGAYPGGADSWAYQEVLATGISTGAPPDEFNQLGQDWAQPPWHPRRLAAQDYRPLRELMGASLAHAGGLRVDHVMGLFRLWWVPVGMTPDRGAYVRYDQRAMVGAVTGAARRAGSIVIGEDLGTVERGVRRFLATHGVLGTNMLWFERTADGMPRPAARWRRDCLATVGTHDMPPAASFLTGDHVGLRAELGLLTRPLEEERREAAAAVSAWRAVLARMGLLPAQARPGSAAMTAALYGFLARSPARLIGVSLADAVGDRRPQNMPGTSDEYPNWRIPLADGAGRAVLLEDLAGRPDVREIISAAAAVSTRT